MGQKLTCALVGVATAICVTGVHADSVVTIHPDFSILGRDAGAGDAPACDTYCEAQKAANARADAIRARDQREAEERAQVEARQKAWQAQQAGQNTVNTYTSSSVERQRAWEQQNVTVDTVTGRTFSRAIQDTGTITGQSGLKKFDTDAPQSRTGQEDQIPRQAVTENNKTKKVGLERILHSKQQERRSWCWPTYSTDAECDGWFTK